MPQIIDLTSSLGLFIRHENLYCEGATEVIGGLQERHEQVIFTENRTWTGSVTFPPFTGRDLTLARSVGTRLRGRAGRMLLPVLNLSTPAFSGDLTSFLRQLGYQQEDIERGFTEFEDGTAFSDGTGFALPTGDDPLLDEPLFEGDQFIRLNSTLGRRLAVGDRFSIDGWLHEVEENNDGRVTFSPPLRADFAVGQVVKVSNPEILVRLADDSGWRPVVERGFASLPLEVGVVEAFDHVAL